MTVTVVVGNPKPASRTLDAAVRLASRFGEQPEVVDIITLGAGLLGWGDPAVADPMATVKNSRLIVVASPTFKATYTGVLKLFLDQFATGTGLENVVAIPLMLGAGPTHALAPELLLKPVLVELGAICPTPGLYQLDADYRDDPVADNWFERWGPVVLELAGRDRP